MTSRPSGERLADETIVVWYASQDHFDDETVYGSLAELLSDDEMARANRFVFDRDRRTYIVAHALQRTLLSYYGARDPRAWRFVTNNYGRPEVVAGNNERRLRFNLSHTRGLVACGIGVQRAVGVDVENTTRMTAGVDLARRYFAPREVEDLLALPAKLQARAFFDYWTLKESYIKARGMGLSLPLEQFWFRLKTDQPVGIGFDPRLEDDPAKWQFAQFEPTEQHKLAVAVERMGPDLTIHVEALARERLLDLATR